MFCIHHHDLDGYGAGAVVAKYENDYNPDHYFSADYNNPLPLDEIADGDKVYLVDFSFTKSTVWQLDKLVHEKHCKCTYVLQVA